MTHKDIMANRECPHGVPTDTCPTCSRTEAKPAPTCGHTVLLARDFANQPRPLDGACLFCQRAALVAALERIGNPEFVYSSDDDADTQESLRMADARATLKLVKP